MPRCRTNITMPYQCNEITVTLAARLRKPANIR